MSVSLSSIINTGQNYFITRSLLWSNMVKCSTPSSADCFHTDLRGYRSMKAATTAWVNVRNIGRLLKGESFIFLYINALFPTLKELFRTDIASQIAAEMESSPDSSSDLCCLYVSKQCYQTLLNGLTAHNCHTHHYTTHYYNEQMRPRVLAHHSFIICA